MISISDLDRCQSKEGLIELIHEELESGSLDDDYLFDDESEDGCVFQNAPEQQKMYEALMDEALHYARLGDLEEAKLRLRNWFHPKFASPIDCKQRYDETMAGKVGQ